MLSTYRNMGVFHNRKSCEMVTAFGHNSADAANKQIINNLNTIVKPEV